MDWPASDDRKTPQTDASNTCTPPHPFPFTETQPVVFLAPGAGLGHIVRCAALSLELKNENISSIILSTSRWSDGFAAITGLTVLRIEAALWKHGLIQYLKWLDPAVIVQDTFPFGFKGEDLTSVAYEIPFIYLARRLKLDVYLSRIGKRWDQHSPLIATCIVIEPLTDDHFDKISSAPTAPIVLDQRIRFSAHTILFPNVPHALIEKLENGHLHLVVHSGPEHETQRLIQQAQHAIRNTGKGEIAVINPLLASKYKHDYFDYFPASILFDLAFRIYTGAGYNTVSESQQRPEKHKMIPFQRRYDDQAGRLSKWNRCKISSSVSGTAMAAACIKKRVFERLRQRGY